VELQVPNRKVKRGRKKISKKNKNPDPHYIDLVEEEESYRSDSKSFLQKPDP